MDVGIGHFEICLSSHHYRLIDDSRADITQSFRVDLLSLLQCILILSCWPNCQSLLLDLSMFIQHDLFPLILTSSFFILSTLRLLYIVALFLVILQDKINNTFIALARSFIKANLLVDAVNHTVCWVLPMRG